MKAELIVRREWTTLLMTKFLVYLFQEYDKDISEDLVGFWLEQLSDISPEEAFIVARQLHKTSTFGEPRVQNFFRCLEEKRKAELFLIAEKRRQAIDAKKRRAGLQQEAVTEDQRQANLQVVRRWLKNTVREKSFPSKIIINHEEKKEN
jgi:hypothetical protein